MEGTTYNADLAVVNVDGRRITAYPDGEYVSWEKDEDSMAVTVGANGYTGTSITNDNTGTITITVQQDSSDASFLNRLANSKKIFPVSILSGNEKISATQAFVKKPASGSLEKEITEREFELQCLDLTIE